MEESRDLLVKLIKEAHIECKKQKSCHDCSVYGNGSYCIYMLMADHLLANGITVQSWISAKDDPPKEEQLVLLRCKNGAQFVGYATYCPYDKEYRWRIKTALNSTKLLNKGRVTHWMPLPQNN